MARLLSLSRFIIIIPVLASLLGATVLMVYGAIQTIVETVEVVNLIAKGSDKGIKEASIALIELVDVFLIATVLYIIAVGLYELFIGELVLPQWLVITNLDDLKVKLIGVVVTVLAVLFLGQVVSWDGTSALLPLGAAIALMIAALTWFLTNQGRGKGKGTPTIYSSEKE
jgi:uncharacterized membrane protein YqhA